MPNIAFYGTNAEDYANVTEQMRNALKNNDEAKEVVVSHVPSTVTDLLTGNPAPMARIYHTGSGKLAGRESDNLVGAIVSMLNKSGFDVEIMPLGEFYPKD